MRLFIAEKTSLAEKIAGGLGKVSRDGGVFRVGDDVIVPLAGHVLEQFRPEDYDERYKRWVFEDLPIVPEQWKMKVAKDKERPFNNVKRLIQSASVVVNACDPDREGQLIGDEVIAFCGFRGPVKRLWHQGEDKVNMARGLSALLDNNERRLLSASALMRQRADYVVGLSLSRAFGIVAGRVGYRRPFSLGRVIMPTLRLVVERDAIIENFKPLDHFGVTATLEHATGFVVDWLPAKGKPGIDDAGRCTAIDVAKQLAASARGAEAIVTAFTCEPKFEAPPLPFDLGSLGAVAGRRFKMKPKRVLEVVQSLYDKDLVTYPRTESRFLAEAQFAEAPDVFAAIAANSPDHAHLLKGANVKSRSRVWNDSKTKSHHAIIPTLQRASTAGLSDDERKIYDLIVRSYVAQFYPKYEYERTQIDVQLAGEAFRTSGRVPKIAGWRDVLGASKSDEPEVALPRLAVGNKLRCSSTELKAKKTEPPARYTANTLQQDMIDAHKFVTNDKLRALMKSEEDGKHPGIGTPATQGDIIERLSRLAYVDEEKSGALISTPLGRMLIAVLPPAVTDIGMTAFFEMNLGKIASGEVQGSAFMSELVAFVTQNVAAIGKISVPAPSPAIPASLDRKGSSPSGSRNTRGGGAGRGPRKATSTSKPRRAKKS